MPMMTSQILESVNFTKTHKSLDISRMKQYFFLQIKKFMNYLSRAKLWQVITFINNATYFDSFGVEHIPKKVKNFIGNKNIITNIYWIPAYDSVMCRYFCIGFIDFMLKGKSLPDYKNLFSLLYFLLFLW